LERIFILEGLLTVVVGIISKWWIPDWPETARFLQDDDRGLLIARLADDVGDATMNHLNKSAMKRIAKDWKIYLGTVAYMGILNTGYAGSVSASYLTLEYCRASSFFTFFRLRQWGRL
jgi:hypothetical protein